MDIKERITITLDPDVERELKSYAKAQRTTVSALINMILAEKLGLIRKPKTP